MLESTLLLAVLLLGYLFRHRWLPNKQHKTTRQKVGTPAVSPFHAVSIECLKIPCNAASTLANKRFLPQDAPSLPLETCDNPDCRCRYIHHEDRRANDSDRRVKIGIVTDLYGTFGEEERRHKTTGRRNEDLHGNDWLSFNGQKRQ